MAGTGKLENEGIGDAAASGWAKWEFASMDAMAEAAE